MLLEKMRQSKLGILDPIWLTVAIGRSIAIAIDILAIGFPPNFKRRTHYRTEELKSKG